MRHHVAMFCLMVSLILTTTMIRCAGEGQKSEPQKTAALDRASTVEEESAVEEKITAEELYIRAKEIEEQRSQMELYLKKREGELDARAEALAAREIDLEAREKAVAEDLKAISAFRTSAYIVLFIGALFLVMGIVLMFRGGKRAASGSPVAAETARAGSTPSIPEKPRRTRRSSEEKGGTKPAPRATRKRRDQT